jgi:hypothetical protein
MYYAHSSDTADVGIYPSLAVVGGMPAVAHYHWDDQDLLYSHAKSLPPISEDCWYTHVVDSTGTVGIYPSLCLVGSYPAIAYIDTTNDDLKFAIADSAYPNSASDWDIHVVVNVGTTGNYPSMTSFYEGLIGGTRHTVIAFYDSTGGGRLRIARATGTPSGPASWTIENVDTTVGVGEYTSITAISDGWLGGEFRVGICHYDATNGNLRWALSDAWPPTSWYWDTIDDGGGVNNVGQYTAMNPNSSAGGFMGERFPLVTYYDSTNDDVKFARATVAYPTNAALHWVTYTLEDGGTDNVGRSSSPIWYHGEPMVLYNNDTAEELWLARAINSAPADETEWWKHLVAVNSDPMYYRMPLIEFEGKPIFAGWCTGSDPDGRLNFGWPMLY